MFTINVPPLRDMDDDKLLLLEHFSRFYADQAKLAPFSIDESAMKLWRDYHFPGNVRELRNIVERLVIMSPGEQIDARDLPASLLEALPADEPPATAASLDSAPLAAAREEFERQFILRRYRQCGGNMSRKIGRAHV